MKTRVVVGLLAVLVATYAYAQGRTARNVGQVSEFVVTNYPIQGAEALPSDSVTFRDPQAIRADADGAVTVTCWASGNTITLNLVAGEFVPCQVSRLWDSGTDAITLHRFW